MARFIPAGKEKWRWLPAVANKAAPTRAEITAGTDLTPHIATIDGFTRDVGDADASDWGSATDKTVPGTTSLPTSSMGFYDDDTVTTVRDLIGAEGVNGFMARFPYGDVPAKDMEVWPVRSKGLNRPANRAETAKFNVGFSITDTPELDAVVPATGP